MPFKKSLLIALFLLLTGPVYSYDNQGNSVVATGMGGAFVATSNDPSGMFYNPAGLVKIDQYTFYGMYNRQTTFGYTLDEKPYALATAGVIPLSGGVLGLGFSQRGSWAKTTQVVTHNTVALSYARFVSPQFSFGANAKYLFNTNYGDKSGTDFDLGFMYYATPSFTLGLVGENLIGTDVLPDATGTNFYYNRRQVKAGLAYEFANGDYRTRVGFDTIFKQKKAAATETNNLNNFGIQQSIPMGPHNTVSFRAGYSLGKDYNQDFSSLAFGLSYEIESGDNSYRIDYSYQEYPFTTSESMAGDNRLALTIAFGAPKNNGYASRPEKVKTPAASHQPALAEKKVTESPWQTPADANRDSKPEMKPEIRSQDRVSAEMAEATAQPVVPEVVQKEAVTEVKTEKAKQSSSGFLSGKVKQTPSETQTEKSKTTPSEVHTEMAKQTSSDVQTDKVTQTPSTVQTGKPSTEVTTDKTKQSPAVVQADKAKQTSAAVSSGKVKQTPTIVQAEKAKQTSSGQTAQSKPTTSEVTPKVTMAEIQAEKVKPTATEAKAEKVKETSKETKTDNSQKIYAQVQPEPTMSTTPEVQVEKAKQANLHFKMSSKAEPVQGRSGKEQAYMLAFQYNLNDKEREITHWRILIATQPLGNYSWTDTPENLVGLISGRGIPPSVFVWEGKDKLGKRVPPGKYHYAVALQTRSGDKYLSNWSSLTVQ